MDGGECVCMELVGFGSVSVFCTRGREMNYGRHLMDGFGGISWGRTILRCFGMIASLN